MDDLLTRYNKLLRQYEVLHKENEVLKSLLKIHGIEYETRMKEDMNKPIYSLVSVSTITLSIDERIRLFQSLFKGREDVFARRWFNKTTGNLDINLFVLMSGNKDSVIRRSIGVQYVQIETLHH